MEFSLLSGTVTWNYIIIPFFIFIARILDVSLGTVRIITVSKGMRYFASVLGFFEVLIWLLAIGQIMQNLTNPLNYLAYAAGFATGNFVGISLEHRIAMGLALIRVITKLEASDLIKHLRGQGYTVTSIDAEGNRGPVKVFFSVVKRKKVKEVVKVIKKFNPNAFYTIGDVSYVSHELLPIHRGYRKFWEFLSVKRK